MEEQAIVGVQPDEFLCLRPGPGRALLGLYALPCGSDDLMRQGFDFTYGLMDWDRVLCRLERPHPGRDKFELEKCPAKFLFPPGDFRFRCR